MVRLFFRSAFALLLLLLLLAAFGCEQPGGGASARVISQRSQLIGGDRAIGDIGDLLIENEKVRFVVQRTGFSRAFGVYGGSLIDADLRRPSEVGSSGKGVGYDQFSEMFPSMFIQVAAVDSVKVTADGSDGGPARIEATGEAGDFFEMVGRFNRILIGSNTNYSDPRSPARLRYTTIYELQPGARYLTIRFQVKNISGRVLTFPGEDSDLLETAGLPMEGLTIPVGDVALFGASGGTFMPGVGFDMRFELEKAYSANVPWPAFPGLVGEFVASTGKNVSYGIALRPSERNFVYNKRAIYDDGKAVVTKSSLLVPFVTSGAFGAFYEDAPPAIDPGESFEVEKYFMVGTGDVGSVLDVLHGIREAETGRLAALLLDAQTGQPAMDATVVVYQRLADGRRPFSQYYPKEGGFVGGTLRPGAYSLKVLGEGRPNSAFVDFEVRADKVTMLQLPVAQAGLVTVHVRDEGGRRLPAKITVVGRYGAENAGQPLGTFLYDLAAGEHWRSDDLVPDTEAAHTRRYIEKVAFTSEGVARVHLPPGRYQVVSSRGPEYTIAASTLEVRANENQTAEHILRRAVDSRGWVAVDTHVHSTQSPDSPMSLDERVRSLAAEGVDVAVATDHNVVTDYGPYIDRNNLREWMFSMVGLELTTFESGHFNSYPLNYDAGEVTHGAIRWAQVPPDVVFEQLRSLGKLGPENTIVQVNHPRDAVLGYYAQYNRDSATHSHAPPLTLNGALLAPSGPAFKDEKGETTFSFDYDAVELANGKLYWLIRHFRVPDELPDGMLPDSIPPAGTVLLDKEGKIAFPGVVDDWFNLLNLGYRYVGVGSGDSHSAFDEAGQFRTMVYVGDDRPEALTDEAVVAGLKSRRVVVTNGPLLDFYVDDPVRGAIGKTIVAEGDAQVRLSLSLRAAPWIGVGRINIIRNGEITAFLELGQGRDFSKDPLERSFDLKLAEKGGMPVDSWFVVEAIGYDSMFPVIRPLEVPPLLLTDAIGSLAGPLGLGADEFGALRPPEVFPVTAYAITNPVWVSRTKDPWQAPGLPPFEQMIGPVNDPKFQRGITAPAAKVPRARQLKAESRAYEWTDRRQRQVPLFHPLPGNVYDVRHAICRHGLPHGHGSH